MKEVPMERQPQEKILQCWQLIQERICPRCLDGDGQGDCRLPIGEECALKSFLPQVVMTITQTKSDSMEAYVSTLRSHVCGLCDHQKPDMTCKKRNDLECALDRYYPIIVEIIEAVRSAMDRVEPDGFQTTR